MNANKVKNAVLRYFRFDKQCSHVATEVWDCDVIASDEKALFEVEVKISWGDYKREFDKQKHRMADAAGLINLPGDHEPNYRYFAAPSDLAHRIKEDLKTHHQHYGIIAVREWVGHFYTKERGEYEKETTGVTVIKRAKKIHGEPPSGKALMQIVKRISSELITMREAVRN